MAFRAAAAKATRSQSKMFGFRAKKAFKTTKRHPVKKNAP